MWPLFLHLSLCISRHNACSSYGSQYMHKAVFVVVQYLSVCVCLSVCLSVRHEPVLCLNGVRYSHSYYTYRRWISRKWYMLRATVTQEVIPLMNGTTFDDLAWFLTSASRSQYTSKVNISKPVHATDKLLRDTNRKPYPSYRMVPWPWLTPWPTFQVRSPKANHAGLSATAHLLVNLH